MGKYDVTGSEFLLLLQKFGFSGREFARINGVSGSFITRDLGQMREIPWKWVQKFKNLIKDYGFEPEAFEIALKEIRGES